MLVHDVQASIRFYQTLGFYVATTEMDAQGRPLWALLRRDDADLFVERRDRWPESIPLMPSLGAMSLVLGGRVAASHVDPDGTVVHVEPLHRRAA